MSFPHRSGRWAKAGEYLVQPVPLLPYHAWHWVCTDALFNKGTDMDVWCTCGLAQISFDRASSSWRSCVATKFFFVEFEKGTRSDLPPTSSRLWKLRRNPRSLVDSIEPSRQATHSVPFVAATERGQLQTRRCGRTGIKNSESKWKGFLYVLGEM